MFEVYQRLGTHCHEPVDAEVVLDHEQRTKGRLKTITADGQEVRIFLERGKPLLVGEYLRTHCGKTLRVAGATEPVAKAHCDDWLTFAKACYHLGNRHVKMQVGERWLRITPDHVLEELLQLLGLTIIHEEAVFVHENGAYGGHGHAH
ncbi:urease accessory protein UreE [Halioxenophilus aromaticivorans]|uniref:Urease accessory protein UreE n=1 Tax=Halioxenophilus aromaticivorans TaxID=1306992 RepID=A0AAV3UAF0_9ALTE